MSARLHTLALSLVIFFLAAIAISAELPLPPKEPVMPNLPQLARRSGYIFSGTVKSVERITPASANAVPVVRIIFHVDKGYLGVRSGQDLPVQEYAGLWQAGQTYRRGERILLFLYPPSKLGLTSTIGGMSGRFAVEPGGIIVVDPGCIPVTPLGGPVPRGHGPARIQLNPEEFKRALRSALEAKP
jgi:hypothetical protein